VTVCRIAAYVGDPAPLSILLYDPQHSLQAQAYAPRELRSGHVNVDGTGVCWWPDGEKEPLRYATDLPPWSDPNLPALAHRLRASVQLAAVRSATPGMPHGPGAVAPFAHGQLAGCHNGWIRDFHATVARRLLAALSDEALARVDTITDSRLVFLTVAAAYESHPAAGLAAALQRGLTHVTDACVAAGTTATLTVAVANSEQVAAANAAVGEAPNSLYVRPPGEDRRAAVLASEPLDDHPAWRPVPPDTVVVLDRDGPYVQGQPL
jgi:gamma-glutamyl hercynylcysteine S-oxide hydrolase